MSFDKIFGKSGAEKRLAQFQPKGFNAPGLTGSFANDTFSLTRTPQGNQAIEELVRGFQTRAKEFGDLRPSVKPGFGRLTRSRVEAIRGAGERAVGNLREELSRRRVAGSSFAQREIAATEAEFGRLEEQSRAESFLAELDLTKDLIDEQTKAAISGLASVLTQLNFETDLAAQLSVSAGSQDLAARTGAAEAASARRAGFAEVFGIVLEGILAA